MCVYMCVCIYIYIYMYNSIHIQMHVHVQVHIHMHIHIYIYIYICIYTYIYTYLCMYTYIYIYIHITYDIYICIAICICICKHHKAQATCATQHMQIHLMFTDIYGRNHTCKHTTTQESNLIFLEIHTFIEKCAPPPAGFLLGAQHLFLAVYNSPQYIGNSREMSFSK